ncbi:hypothetical protein FA95DRAFT_619023 [Auriscalpium vulgare]|uniref:Uncharacterized protein n=1 Tax=Auriscalpium vulgare TaxID=40419 RepID=A0ACB8S3C1_9AGAM|nr:hypothetical protein FA95DRAFT_619023 [Auriscalpium vulgare]
MADPSVALADAFKSISTATLAALRAYEQGARAQIAHTDDEVRTARRERDDALAAMHACQQGEQEHKLEAEKWKAEVRPAPTRTVPLTPTHTAQLAKADIVNLHQAELVMQLRREAQQWKEQCLRLQDASRGEIEDWKQQFLRVDKERARLSALLEHAVLTAPPFDTRAPYTPRRPEPKRASTSSAHALPVCDGGPAPTPKRPPPQTQTPGVFKSRVVRRVQAVIQVPVKEEEDDEDEDDDQGEGGLGGYATDGAVGLKRRKGAAPRRRVGRWCRMRTTGSGMTAGIMWKRGRRWCRGTWRGGRRSRCTMPMRRRTS